MRYVALVVLLHQLLLGRRALGIDVDDYKMDPAFVPLVQIYGAASLPLGIEPAFAEHKDIIWFSTHGTLFKAVTRDERAVLAVARIIQPRIYAQVVCRLQVGCQAQTDSKQCQGHIPDHKIHVSFLTATPSCSI